MEREEIIEKFCLFLEEIYKKELTTCSLEGKKSLSIDFSKLDKFDIDLADLLLENPDEILGYFEEAAYQVEPDLPKNFRIRFFNLPEDKEIRIRNLRSEHIGKFICVDGIVVRASEVRPEILRAIFQCVECGAEIEVEQKTMSVKKPDKCPNCGNKRGFNQIRQELYDARWIVIEEPFEVVEAERPSSLMIYLKEDLTSPKMRNKTDPGNRIKITGILKEIPRKVRGTRSRQLEIYLEANYIEPLEIEWEELEISEADEKKIIELAKSPDIYDKLIKSIAPGIYGLEHIKEAIALQLFGGEPKILPDKSRIRGNIHILLIGDPSTAKSQIMKVVSKLMPRARYVSGKGTTLAGLTASVVRDEEFFGGWVLEAGAVVLSNRSVCCLHPDTKVLCNLGFVPIKSLSRNYESVILKNGGKAQINYIPLQTISFDLKRMKCTVENVELVARRKYKGELLKFKLYSGFELLLTPNHLLIDGNDLKWKPASKFKIGDMLLSPLLLPFKNKELFVWDIFDQEFKICLKREQKKELKKIIRKKYKSLSEFNRKHSLNPYFLSGGLQIKIRKLKEILKDLGIFEKWKNSKFGFGQFPHLYIPNKLDWKYGYLLGFILGDGYLKKDIRITQSQKKKEFIDQIKKVVKGIIDKNPLSYFYESTSKIRGRKIESKSETIIIGCSSLTKLFSQILKNKLRILPIMPTEFLQGFFAGILDSDGCISVKKYKKKGKIYSLPHIEILLSNDREINWNIMLALRRINVFCKLVEKKPISRLRITGRNDVINFIDFIKAFSIKAKKAKIPKRIRDISSTSEKLPLFVVEQLVKQILSEVKEKDILNKKGVSSTLYSYLNAKYQPSKSELKRIKRKLKDNLSKQTIEFIDSLLDGKFYLDKIVEIRKIKYDGFVYDLYVPATNNFVANSIFVHNCIDEFEKMDKSDQIALHEAMEQCTVSIAKANIVATLPAQTAILAGGNPKLGRFDPYLPIKEQIDIPETLLARFDLKFALRDRPNPEIDEKIADYILQTRHFQAEFAKPAIDPLLLRKYIAYARKNCHPKLSREAGEILKRFFVKMREKALEGAPIPITLRQYEALIRMAEASAKIRLSNIVTKEDAERAIKLMKVSLREFGFEPETGQFDIDRAEGLMTAAQRSKIRIMLDIIDELTKIQGAEVDRNDIISKAVERGVENAEEILDKMVREGIVYSPRVNKISKL